MAPLLSAIWRVRVRLLTCAAVGVLMAWLWHLGYQDPPWRLDDAAFWLHLATEGMVAAGIGGALFVLSGATVRYYRARQSFGQSPVDGVERSP
ncbi:MAG: hypothetical protein KatS3mg060_1499 [Dehalococcoidia bacterium]|nr:MAG: hypothetical protein KatS3mg060_1499 [Dehalococcoidia bacterium]